MPRRVIVVAFQFPPYGGSSAVQRALGFVRHLPKFGWEPIVLTAHPRAYEDISADLAAKVPGGIHVERAFALDAKRHLAWWGRYPEFLAYPDRWRVWQWGGTFAGMRLIRRFGPAAIWSTYPIVSAHEIGLRLAERSCLPWIADFRDPMVEEDFPEDAGVRADFSRREEAYSRRAACFTVTTPGMRDWFVRRYPRLGANRVKLIENGYDETAFENLDTVTGPMALDALTLLHSGELYPGIRDPINLFGATRKLIDRGVLGEGEVRFRFRGAGDDSIVARAAEQHRMTSRVEILPRVPYREALREMMAAEGLIILQGAQCNRQIPAKVYEYLRTGRPILGITDPSGDTGRTLLAAGCDCVAPLESREGIEGVLRRFVTQLRKGSPSVPRQPIVDGASRQARAGALAGVLDQLVGSVEA